MNAKRSSDRPFKPGLESSSLSIPARAGVVQPASTRDCGSRDVGSNPAARTIFTWERKASCLLGHRRVTETAVKTPALPGRRLGVLGNKSARLAEIPGSTPGAGTSGALGKRLKPAVSQAANS